MVEFDPSAFNPLIAMEEEDEHIVLKDCEMDARTHGPNKASTLHTHDETHIIFMRTGEMEWTVGDEEFHAKPGDTIITPAGTEHKFEVVGGSPSKTSCLIAPARTADEQNPSGTHEITKPDEHSL